MEDSRFGRLACADFTWPLLPHTDVLRYVKMLGFEGIDLGLFAERSHVRPEQVRGDIAFWSGVLMERIAGAGLELADFFVQASTSFEPMAVNHPDPAEQEASWAFFRDMLEMARRMGAPGITLLPGARFGEENWDVAIRRSSEALKRRIDEAGRHGIPLSIEGHVGSCVDTPEKLARLLELTPGLSLTLDYTHFTRAGIADAEIEPLIAHARHFHCRGGAPGRLQTSFAENTIDYRRVIQTMKRVGYRGYFAIEYVWVDWEGANRTENTCETILFRDLAREEMA